MFRKKSPKRLYYPTKSNWYTKPRRKSRKHITRTKSSNGFFSGIVIYLQNTIYIAVGIAIIIILITVLTLSSYFSVTNIEVVRENFNIDSATIENQLNKYVGHNIFLFSRYWVVKSIKESFPEFVDIRVKKILPRTIKIELRNYPIVANLRAYYVLPKAEEPLEEIVEDAITLKGETYIPPTEDRDITHLVFDIDAVIVEEEIVEDEEVKLRAKQIAKRLRKHEGENKSS